MPFTFSVLDGPIARYHLHRFPVHFEDVVKKEAYRAHGAKKNSEVYMYSLNMV